MADYGTCDSALPLKAEVPLVEVPLRVSQGYTPRDPDGVDCTAGGEAPVWSEVDDSPCELDS